MKAVGSAEFEATVMKEPLALVDFHAPWCAPCRQMEPALAAVDGDPAPVYTVDVDAEPDLAARFGVRGLPTVMVFKDGEPVDVRNGAQGVQQLKAFVSEHA